MGQIQKYTDDQLLEAVIRFADITTGKIKATELERWARKNMPFLEEVTRDMFIRPRIERDKGGNKIKIPNPCKEKIDSVNKSRSAERKAETNPLLKSADIDAFFSLSITDQRRAVLDARKQMEELIKRNLYLEQENRCLSEDKKRLKLRNDELQSKIADIEAEQATLRRTVAGVSGLVDSIGRKAALEEIGICDGGLDLVKNAESLDARVNGLLEINETPKKTKKRPPTGEEYTNSMWKNLKFRRDDDDE